MGGHKDFSRLHFSKGVKEIVPVQPSLVIPAIFKRESSLAELKRWIPDTFSEKNIQFFPKSAPRMKRER